MNSDNRDFNDKIFSHKSLHKSNKTYDSQKIQAGEPLFDNNMGKNVSYEDTDGGLLGPFMERVEENSLDPNIKLRDLLQSRLDRQSPKSTDSISSEELASSDNSSLSSESDSEQIPEAPIKVLKEKADEIIDKIDDESNSYEEDKLASLQNEDDDSSKSSISKPQAVAKRLFKFIPEQNVQKNTFGLSRRTLATCFFSFLFLVFVAILVLALDQLRNEESKSFVQNFMSISETDSKDIPSVNQFEEYDNSVLRIRKPVFSDEYLNKILNIYYNNYINSFVYEQNQRNFARSSDKPTIAIDYIFSNYKNRLLSIVLKIDTWDYSSDTNSQESNEAKDKLFNAGYNSDGSIVESKANANLRYKQKFIQLFYDQHLRRLMSPSELMDSSTADGFLREYHLSLNESLPNEQKLPEISTLRSQKNLPLLLFSDNGISEIIEWKHPSLQFKGDIKDRVPEDSYTASAITNGSTFKTTVIPYQTLNPILHIDLVFEDEDKLKNQEKSQNNAEAEDRAMEAGKSRARSNDSNETSSDEAIEPLSSSENNEAQEEIDGSNLEKAKLFFPEQKSPFSIKGQAAFTNLPNPYADEAPNSAQDLKYIAFTFDDGPYINVTPKVLNELDKYNGNATFYVLGISTTGAEYLFEDILGRGNEIGNHTYYHDPMTSLSRSQVEDTLYMTDQVVKNNTISKYMPVSIRPPYGDIDDETASYDPRPFVMWDVDSNDWYNQENISQTVSNVVNNVKPGSVILMHDSHLSSYEALSKILPNLYQQGYRFVTVSKLFEIYHKPLEGGAINYAAHD